MQEVFNFIISHLEAILSALTLIISIVVFILRKKPVKFIDTMKQMLVEWLPAFIIQAEKSGLKGEEKIVFCLKSLYEFFDPTHSSTYDYFLEHYERYLRMHIEAILSTPQKKEVK